MLENTARKEIPLDMMEFHRRKLEYIVEEKNFDLLNEQVIKASEHMDQVIINYYCEKKHLKKSSKGSKIIIFPD